MSTLSLGQFRLEAVPDGIWIRIAGTDLKPIHLGIDQARKLEEFLRDQNLAERRLGFRVPVQALEKDERPLQCELDPGSDAASSATAIDLSLTGVLLRAPDRTAAEAEVVKIALTLSNLQATLTAKVVRSEPPLLALHFVESLKDGELDPPDPLISIYRELEARWLRNRITGTDHT